MVRLCDLIQPESIAVSIDARDKPHAIRFISEKLARQSGLDAERVRSALAAREELGSTGIGHGIALPHVRLADLDRSYAAFGRLSAPIDFDAIDNQPVDLLCAIISPKEHKCANGEPLSLLAAISRILRNASIATALRQALDARSVQDILINSEAAAVAR
jgi:PTS system nitrogen regulatory IIA component